MVLRTQAVVGFNDLEGRAEKQLRTQAVVRNRKDASNPLLLLRFTDPGHLLEHIRHAEVEVNKVDVNSPLFITMSDRSLGSMLISGQTHLGVGTNRGPEEGCPAAIKAVSQSATTTA